MIFFGSKVSAYESRAPGNPIHRKSAEAQRRPPRQQKLALMGAPSRRPVIAQFELVRSSGG
jgi:hypothetical protein